MLKSLCLFGECKEDINLRIIYMRLEFPSSLVVKRIEMVKKKTAKGQSFSVRVQMKLKFLISFGRVQKNKRTESIIKKRQIYKKQSIIEKQRERVGRLQN